jgi:hypothetical protein
MSLWATKSVTALRAEAEATGVVFGVVARAMWR